MTILDVECPECGSKPGEPCYSTDILIGFKKIEEGHPARHEAAAVGLEPSPAKQSAAWPYYVQIMKDREANDYLDFLRGD